MYLRTKDPLYESAAKFWTNIFGLNFALGVVTGIVMEFEFGTNWAVYSRYVGDVFGSALAAEGIFAFFLESGFLAILLFGWDVVGPKMHFFATVMVALGGIFSSVWITIANSWQQTPAGHVIREHVINGQAFKRAEIVDFWAMVFNPSSVNRLIHVWLGAFILGAFFVMSISAWYLLKNRHHRIRQPLVHGRPAARPRSARSPNSAPAIFRRWASPSISRQNWPRWKACSKPKRTRRCTSSAGPMRKTQTVRFPIAIPGMLSWLVHVDAAEPVPRARRARADWGQPPVWLTFQSYHLMIAIGMLFIVTTLYASYLRWRGTLFTTRWLLWYFVFAVVLAFVANEVGWVTAEVGRQPWIVYPTMIERRPRRRPAHERRRLRIGHRANTCSASIIMFGVIYLLLFVLWIMLLNNKIQHGPEPVDVRERDARSGGAGCRITPTQTRALSH